MSQDRASPSNQRTNATTDATQGKDGKGKKTASKVPRPTIHFINTPLYRPHCRERTFLRLYPPVCAWTKEWHPTMIDCVHGLPWSLETTHKELEAPASPAAYLACIPRMRSASTHTLGRVRLSTCGALRALWTKVWTPVVFKTCYAHGVIFDGVNMTWERPCKQGDCRKQFDSIRLAIGTWEFRSGRWERCLNLNGFFNLELLCKHLHGYFDGNGALGSGCAAFYPVKPSLRECVRRLEVNKTEGLPFDKVFPELWFEYAIFIFDNDRIKIFLFDGQDRVYPAPIGAAKAKLKQEAEGIRKDLPSSEVILPNPDFVFRSHLNPCVAIPDMLLKLRYRHGDADSPKWNNAPQQEIDLFRTLSPATDYILDRTKWDVITEPPSSQRYKMDGIRFSTRNRPVQTDGPQVLHSRIPTRDVKTAASPTVKAPASAPSSKPSAKPSRIPRLSLTSGTFAPPQVQPRMRTRSQSKWDAKNNGENKMVTSSRDY